MRLRFLRPVNGWPGFLTELAIVVLGVLIALGAQQLAEAARWRSEVREFRSAMDDELAYNLGAYQDRREQSACIVRRLDQLDAWHRGWRSGQRLRLASPITRPLTLNVRSSVWQSRTADVAAHLGLEQRLNYAYLYDSFAGYQSILVDERRLWNELLDFEGADDLGSSDLLRLRGLIERGRIAEKLIRLNWPPIARRTAAVGIRARDDDEVAADKSICKPLSWLAV